MPAKHLVSEVYLKIRSAHIIPSVIIAGMSELSPPNVNLKKLYEEETSPEEPILIIISTGADPSQDLEELAKEIVGSDKYFQVAMGQGQAEIAMKLLNECSANGSWLCLKNLHLVTSWLGTLEKVNIAILKIFFCD